MTVRELKNFLSKEQNINLSDDECKQIISEYEPSANCRKRQLMSSTGFSHFMVFSEVHDVFDHSKTETVYQVRKGHFYYLQSTSQTDKCNEIFSLELNFLL